MGPSECTLCSSVHAQPHQPPDAAMVELRGRALIEARFGAIGTGAQRLKIGDTEYTIEELLQRMGLFFDDAKPIDLVAIEDHYAVRYYDAQDQRVVAHEFDSSLQYLGELRAHIAEWIGEDAYYSLFSGH